MAGFLLTFGQAHNSHFDKVASDFENLKNLKPSFYFKNKNLKLKKYQRAIDIQDCNYFESNYVVVCCVGSILFRNFNFEKSIQELGAVLNSGIPIKQIINEIDGNFNLIIFEKTKNKIYFITDFGGVINSYIYKKDDMYIISTSFLALANSFSVTPDIESILLFIQNEMFYDETTYFHEIKTLKPASIYKYDISTRALSRKEYWFFPRQVNKKIDLKTGAEKITKSLFQITDFIPLENTIFDFTGGFDSRFILSLVYARSQNQEIHTFFFGPPESREAKIVEKNCNNIGVIYNNFLPSPSLPDTFFDSIIEAHKLSDGLISAFAYASTLINQKIKINKFRYAVHGPFGELFRQRRWITEFGMRGRLKPPNLDRLLKYRELTEPNDNSIFNEELSLYVQCIPAKVKSIYKKSLKIFCNNSPNTLQLDYLYFCQKARRWGGRTITTTNQLIKAICPLWFRRPLEISLSLSPQHKKSNKLMRFIVEKESPEFAKQKMITGAPFVQINCKNFFKFLPSLYFFLRIAIRKFFQVVFKKHIWEGLTTPDYDSGVWFRGALAEPKCEEILDYDNMFSKILYSKKEFNEFKKRAKKAEFKYYNQLGKILTVELTLRYLNLRINNIPEKIVKCEEERK